MHEGTLCVIHELSVTAIPTDADGRHSCVQRDGSRPRNDPTLLGRGAYDWEEVQEERHAQSRERSAVLRGPFDLQRPMGGTSGSAPVQAKGQAEDQLLEVPADVESSSRQFRC